MAVHFSVPKSPVSFSSTSLQSSESPIYQQPELRQMTEDVAKKILVTFLEYHEKAGLALNGKQLTSRVLNLEHQEDPRAELIGKNSMMEDPTLTTIFRQEQLQLLHELLIHYPCAQHLNLAEFIGMVIIEAWDELHPFLPKDFLFKKEDFAQQFWSFYLTSHVAMILYSHKTSNEDVEVVIKDLVGAPKQWSFFKPFVTYLLTLTKAIHELPESIQEKNVFSKRLQLLVQLTTKSRTLFIPEPLFSYYPQGFPCCRLQELVPNVKFLSTILKEIVEKHLHSEKQASSFLSIAHYLDRLQTLIIELSAPSIDADKTFSSIIRVLSQIIWETHKASIDREEDLSLYTMKAKYKEPRASCVFDISSYKILLQFFRGIVDSLEHSGFYYPSKSLLERILATMKITTIAEESSYSIDSKLAAILPRWEEVLRDCCNLNLENSQKNLEFGLRILKLSDPSLLYGEYKRPFFEFFTHQQYLKSQETSHFVKKIKKIHAKALEVLSELPAALNSPATQLLVSQEIQVALTLKFLEFHLSRDMTHLIYNKNLMITDCIPEEFFELLSLEIPQSSPSFCALPISPEEEKEDVELVEHLASSLKFAAEPLPQESPVASQELLSTPSHSPGRIIQPVISKPTALAKIPQKLASPPSCQEAMIRGACQDIKRARKYRQIENILNSLNLYVSGQTGSHAIFTSSSGAQVVVPKHLGKDLKKGTLSSISRQAFLATHPPAAGSRSADNQ